MAKAAAVGIVLERGNRNRPATAGLLWSAVNFARMSNQGPRAEARRYFSAPGIAPQACCGLEESKGMWLSVFHV